LYPYQGTAAPTVTIEPLATQPTGPQTLATRISIGGKGADYVFVSFAGKGQGRFGEFATDAEAAVIRTDAGGAVKGVFVMNGTYVTKNGARIYPTR
jgi:hypothetical protein